MSCLLIKVKTPLIDKFDESKNYALNVIYVERLFRQPQVELRNKDDELLIKPFILDKDINIKHVEYFFLHNAKDDQLYINVNTGSVEWVWSKDAKDVWHLISQN